MSQLKYYNGVSWVTVSGYAGATGPTGPTGPTGAQGPQGDWSQAQSINAQTGTTYTLASSDAGKLITLNNSNPISLTVPQDSAATIAVGTYIDLMQIGTGQVTVVAGTGATLWLSAYTAKARAQYSRFAVQKVAANTWVLFGDLAVA